MVSHELSALDISSLAALPLSYLASLRVVTSLQGLSSGQPLPRNGTRCQGSGGFRCFLSVLERRSARLGIDTTAW